MSQTKHVHIKTFGCQMNVYDSERMMAALEADGYKATDDAKEADLILLNTCHIREKAAEKVYSDLGRLKSLKDKNPNLKVGVTGCVAQAEGAEIVNRQPIVDLVVGPQSYHRLPDMLKNVNEGTALVDTEFPVEDKFDHLKDNRKKMPLSAFLSVQEGCDKFCSFCVVPYTRGGERSRPAAKILAEARDMVAAGVREITLLGQNVNGYHGEDEHGNEIGLAALIERLAKIDDLWRIRFTTSHPNDMDDALIEAFRDIEKLQPFLHLPIQSGSDKILKAMNRHHTRAAYLKIIERLKVARPDIALSGDFIVAFPGETDSDFEDTMSIVREAGYAHGYSFKYSPRPGTPAASMELVNSDVASARLTRLQEEINRVQFEFLDGLIGKEIEALVEKPGKFKGQLSGRTPYLFPLAFDGDSDQIGTIVRKKILSRSHATLLASKMA